ncbi:hypothetical protein F4604DRAFT_1685779 [Suillus subluteus]|nr:hypothetical protein F4604DRAFT_1685779 [Suillus subluteus]
MTKAKNDTVHERDNNADARPSKKAKIIDTGDEHNDGEATKDSEVALQQEENEGTSVTSNSPATGTSKSASTAGKRGSGALQPTLSIRSVLPNPTKCLIDETEVEGLEETLISRIQKLSEYTNARANIYALGKLLPTATWGQYKLINDHSKVLCDPTTGEPLTIWTVSQIARMWFTKSGVPENQASLTIMPLSKSLSQQSATLLAKMSNPVLNINEQSTQVICAIKWQNGKQSDREAEAILFDTVYDVQAEGSLKTYSEWPLWNLADLKTGDLILLEMKMTRYSKKLEDKWHSCVQYEMIAISLLDISEIVEEETQGICQIDGLAI